MPARYFNFGKKYFARDKKKTRELGGIRIHEHHYCPVLNLYPSFLLEKVELQIQNYI